MFPKCRWGTGKGGGTSSLLPRDTLASKQQPQDHTQLLFPWHHAPCTNTGTGEAARVWLQRPKLATGEAGQCLVGWAMSPGSPQPQGPGTFPNTVLTAPSPTACQRLFVESPRWGLWPGWMAPEETFYWGPHLGPGITVLPGLPCPRSVPAVLLCSPLKAHSGTGGPRGTLTLSLEAPGLKMGGLHPPRQRLAAIQV